MKTKKPTTLPAIDIGISAADRKRIAEGLSGLLADSYTLYLMTHNFHWNVTGPMFNTLHLMFMGQYTEQWNALDVIAERIRALGHAAPGTYKEFVRLASIAEVEGVPSATDMIRHLVAAQEATARTARKLFPVVDKANDQPSADVLTQRLEVHEKTAWMLRSLLEE
ncbi:MAG: DNA starvation/stationary phase protection protein [Rhodocyclales bacterium]|nr:DNA starvation/stationary phase protection protein [Rhodocyclales bacterium]